MANGHLKPEDDSKIIVNDLYDEGKQIEIPLDKNSQLLRMLKNTIQNLKIRSGLTKKLWKEFQY